MRSKYSIYQLFYLTVFHNLHLILSVAKAVVCGSYFVEKLLSGKDAMQTRFA